MTASHYRIRVVTVLLILVGGWLPLAVYWQFVGRVPSVTSEEAKEFLTDNNGLTALVDVRTPAEFEESHLAAAENWPYEQITASTSADAVPKQLERKRLLLICQSGILSSLAAVKLRELSIPEVFSVQGGLQNWVAGGEQPCAGGLCRLKLVSGETSGLPFRTSSLLEQWGAVLTGFAVKPLYTLLSLVIAVWLWRQKATELVALRWAMLFFFVGENFCAANYLFYNDGSRLFEYLHSFGMVVCFGLTTYALFEGIDRRLVKFSDIEGKCAALGLCSRCIKYADVPCGFQQVFLLLIPAVMAICFMPLSAELLPLAYNTEILGSFYNYSHPVVHQLFEVRYLPVAALVLFATAWGILKFGKTDPVPWSKVLFAAGVGAIGFSFFRLILLHVYRDHLAWFGFWEEVTELLFVAGTGLVLWIFQRGLFGAKGKTIAAAGREGQRSGE
jgi:rhodanese-related sulfurtransferase